MQFVEAQEADWPIIEKLAQQSWWHGYANVLSDQQIQFMLQQLYSEEGIRKAMQTGQRFYLATENHNSIGFMALQHKQPDILRIEKLYLLPQVQGKGYGRALLDFAQQRALALQIHTIELNVNRKNKAYFFYLKQGFHIVEEIDIPYFNFILDDYIMQKTIPTT
ncbi:GNAT family N-acetyltransferase [Sphingobacterium paludis]|uniref:Ribosomal protein S18 acetylase RimI-like enzyme n=1 Tax=Sphingobacterium paludis TaxID=1476465 RepID=A0A4R7D5E8_9SPHI|nr:GNAT family N-acetyltransferase [Sphingobacterium paludis]TDS14914.1 ribosomal protein S18 acetylase RimI-like enzyme [Sphingobacterium paludis]